MFKKTIEMQFARDGKRTKLVGFVGQITDESGLVLHSQLYPTKDAAQWALDSLVHELLIDYAERGLVDTVPEPSLDAIRDAVAQMEDEQCNQDFAQPQPDAPVAAPVETFTFTRSQLNDLLFAAIDMYLEFRDVHEHGAEASRFEAVDEMFQGLDADRELAQFDPTERLRLQLT